MTNKKSIVVIGGGYAGAMAASRLTQSRDVSSTVINPRPWFVNRIRLHQRVAGTDDAVVPYSRVLNPEVELITDTVTTISAETRTLALAGGDTVDYDYLIYAVGSGSAQPDLPGAEHVYPLATLEEAQRLHTALATLPSTAPVTVIGAGPTGIETAAELAEQGRHVTLLCGGPLGPTLHPRGRRSVAHRLDRLGVVVVDGAGSVVTSVTAEHVELRDGNRMPSAVTIFTAGFSVPDLAARSGLTTDPDGKMITDDTLTSVDDARIVATGDAAAPSNRPFRMSCQAAVQLGPQAADTVLSKIANREASAVKAGFGGLCISLGRHAGIYQFTRMNDTARSVHISGAAGALVKEIVCRGILDHQVGRLARRPQQRLFWLGNDQERTQQVRADALQGQPFPTGTGQAS